LKENDSFSRAEVSAMNILYGGIKAAKIALKLLEATNESLTDDASSRVASITVGLNEDLKHKVDVDMFHKESRRCLIGITNTNTNPTSDRTFR
jgi:hypothetical protein